jgi:hypothetical protein
VFDRSWYGRLRNRHRGYAGGNLDGSRAVVSYPGKR